MYQKRSEKKKKKRKEKKKKKKKKERKEKKIYKIIPSCLFKRYLQKYMDQISNHLICKSRGTQQDVFFVLVIYMIQSNNISCFQIFFF